MRALAIAFFVLAGIIVLAQLAAAFVGGGDMAGLLSFALQLGLQGLLVSIALGLVYWALDKAGTGGLSTVFGWIHFIFALLAALTGAAGHGLSAMLRSGASDLPLSNLSAILGLAYVFATLGWLAFIIALIVAIGNIRRSLTADAF